MADDMFKTRWDTSPIIMNGTGANRIIDWNSLFSKGVSPKQARLPQAEDAKSAANSGQQTMATAEAKPCAKCDTNQPFSLAFLVTDGTPGKARPCAGMYYTVVFKTGAYPPALGQTDENGLTARYFSSNPNEEIYLYIGHREKDDGYPTSQGTDEEKYDEAPLKVKQVKPISDKEPEPAPTKRRWKPWSVSDDGRGWLKKEEGYSRVPYNDHLGYATIGTGHLLHKSGVTAADNKEYPAPTTPEEIKARDELLNGYFESDVRVDGRAEGDKMEDCIFVPLYPREYDALISQGFQFGGATVNNPSSSFRKWLNRGRYTKVGDVFPLFRNRTENGKKVYDEKVASRSARNKDTFLNGAYKGPGE